jgi:tRNA A-37 threonylcarbamoyl transferase component Bud32
MTLKNDLGSPIAYGRTAEMFEWEDGQVLKLFHDWFGLEDIRFERRINQAVHASGLPVPAVGEIVGVDDRNGLLYQRVVGTEMWEVIRPWNILRLADQMAGLHAEMHASTIQVDIPDQYQRLVNKINSASALPNDLQLKALGALEDMPKGKRLCHGDFHPGNILVSDNKAVTIDWVDATLGNPLADLARTAILHLGAVHTRQISNPLHKIMARIFHDRYIRTYFTLRPGGEGEYTRWQPIVAAARLSENIAEVEGWLLKQAKKVE